MNFRIADTFTDSLARLSMSLHRIEPAEPESNSLRREGGTPTEQPEHFEIVGVVGVAPSRRMTS